MGSEPFTPVTHVVSDLDGTLIDTESIQERGISTLLERYGHKYTTELKLSVFGKPAKYQSELFTKELNLPITPEQYIEELFDIFSKLFDEVQLMPGAERLIKHLHKHNIPIAIATSSTRHEFELKTKKWKHIFNLFHSGVCCDDPEVKNAKPAPDSYLVAASKFDVQPKSMKNVLVFEDTPTGKMAGLSAGCQVVWVPAHDTPREEPHPTIILNSLLEFRPELFGLPKFDD